MKVLLSLFLGAILGREFSTATTPNPTPSPTPNADFVAKIVGLLTLNDTDAEATTCLNNFALAGDAASPQFFKAVILYNNATRDASVALKACLDDADNGTLLTVASRIFAPYLYVASNVADFDSILTNACNTSVTAKEMALAQQACIDANCANVNLTLIGDMPMLWDLQIRVPRQEENQRCKTLKCVGPCGVKVQSDACGHNSFFFQSYKLQTTAFLYTYLLGTTKKQDVSTLPCRCRWFFK